MKILRLGACGILVTTSFIGSTALAQPPTNLTADDRTAIQSLMTQYAQALSGCRAEEFADLFTPGTGYFSSGFRGRMVGRERLIALVQSERQCIAPPQASGKAASAPTVPTLALEMTAGGVHGIATLGTAEYQDEYTKTPQGWRFASRTVIMATEKAAGLDAREMLAIEQSGGPNLGDHYEADKSGVARLQSSGIKVSVSGDQVTGRKYLKDGAYDDEVYEKVSPGKWRVKSSMHVPAPTP